MQVSEQQVLDYFRLTARIKGSYDILLCAVMEQVKNFHETGYKDGRVAAELAFEKRLKYRRGAFTVDTKYLTSEEGSESFVNLLSLLGGPKLLPARSNRDSADNNTAEDEQAQSESNVQSFRSDRRLLRLVIMRAFMDVAIRKFQREGEAEIPQVVEE